VYSPELLNYLKEACAKHHDPVNGSVLILKDPDNKKLKLPEIRVNKDILEDLKQIG
jgi:hypothetical protein